MQYYILNEDDDPIQVEFDDPFAFWDWMKDNWERRQVAFDDIEGRIGISTVFLGVPRGRVCNRPLLYETLIIGGSYPRTSVLYCTKDDALHGHRLLTQELRGVNVLLLN